MIGSKFNNILKSAIQINSTRVTVKPISNKNALIQFRWFSTSAKKNNNNIYNNRYIIASTTPLFKQQQQSLYNRLYSSSSSKDPMEEKLKSMMSEEDKYEQYQKEKKARKEEMERKQAESEQKTIDGEEIVTPATTSTGSGTTKKPSKEVKEDEKKKIYDDEHEQSMFYIYSVFTAGFIALLASSIYNIASGFNENDNPFQLPYDKMLMIQDVYNHELLKIFDEGDPDFNAFAGPSYTLSEDHIKFSQIGETFIIIIPIVSKKKYLLGHLCIDIVQDGKVVSVGNFFINGINGVVYPLRIPKTKYYTNDPRYSLVEMAPPPQVEKQ